MNKKLPRGISFVAVNSEFVCIDKKKILEFAGNFNSSEVLHWLKNIPFNFHSLSEEKKLNFIFILNSLSFSYWGDPKWTIKYKGKDFDGAYGLIAALGKAIDSGIPILDFSFNSSISKKTFYNILKGNTKIPLFEERWNILRENSRLINERYKGKLTNLIYESNQDAVKLIDIMLENFPSFKDVDLYKGKEVFFNKRCQLFVADIHQVFKSKKLGILKNIDCITACADYKLPQFLRKVGILVYNRKLSDKIDNKIEILKSSEEEIEIRANTIFAIELIKEAIVKKGISITSNEVNDFIWIKTQEKEINDKPYHRTRTVAY